MNRLFTLFLALLTVLNSNIGNAQQSDGGCDTPVNMVILSIVHIDSVNVLADDGGMDALHDLGARSVPVVSCGRDFVFAQSLSALAEFVGVRRDMPILPVPDLVKRIDRVLTVAQSHASQLPNEALGTSLPGRNRTYLDLAYYIPVIVEAFLIAACGDTLTFDLFERRPPHNIQDGQAVAAFGQEIKDAFGTWWQETRQGTRLPKSLKTYYGDQVVEELLERTAWHAAQHTRQLAAVMENLNIVLNDRLTENDLDGLPLPDHVYDDQVPLETQPA